MKEKEEGKDMAIDNTKTEQVVQASNETVLKSAKKMSIQYKDTLDRLAKN